MLESASLDIEFMFSKILGEFILVVLREFAIEFITYTAAAAVINRYFSQWVLWCFCDFLTAKSHMSLWGIMSSTA